MLCEQVNKAAFGIMPDGFATRLIRMDELAFWKRMHFDDDYASHARFMDTFFDGVYAPEIGMFFRSCLMVADKNDVPVGSCFVWKAYGTVNTIHWFKVLRGYEGLGIGRALFTEVMGGIPPDGYPVLLHTQPSSNRAIKLYTDFGFTVLTDAKVGFRKNDIEECLPLLKDTMPERDFGNLQFSSAPSGFLDLLENQIIDEF